MVIRKELRVLIRDIFSMVIALTGLTIRKSVRARAFWDKPVAIASPFPREKESAGSLEMSNLMTLRVGVEFDAMYSDRGSTEDKERWRRQGKRVGGRSLESVS